MSFKVGDIIAWKRAGGEEPLRCEIMELRTSFERDRARLRGDGWIGTHWETLREGLFMTWADHEAAKTTKRKQAKAA